MSLNTEETMNLSDTFKQLRADLEALPSSKRLTFTDTEAIYSIAYNLVAQGHYEEGLRRFAILTLYRPTEAKYLAGLAVCNQMLGRYDFAIGNFAFAANIEPGKPEYLLNIAECEILKKDYVAARETLEAVIAFCKEKGGFDAIRERAEAMLAFVFKGVESAQC
ncbi:MAG: hypothetical protein H6R18_425 [Proteobacteria bacterium]|nr:hypothetical protein [Pseudomonadota bacterium]